MSPSPEQFPSPWSIIPGYSLRAGQVPGKKHRVTRYSLRTRQHGKFPSRANNFDQENHQTGQPGKRWGAYHPLLIPPNVSPEEHDTCTLTIVHACTFIIVHARTMNIVHACTLIIVHACTMIIVQVSAMTIVYVCAMIERSSDRAIERSSDRAIERSIHRVIERSGDRAI